jgi:hypothetical protein
MQKQGWPSHVYHTITWEYFAASFTKLTSAQQIMITKKIIFWCTNNRYRRDRGQIKGCCFCRAQDKDWCHVLTCNGTGALIYRTGSWADLQSDLVKLPIHQYIWSSIEHGLQHFARHPSKDNHSRPRHAFGPSLRANHVLLNNAASSQTSIGWHNFTNGRILKEWSKLWSKVMGPQLATTCERAMIKSLWDYSYRLWIFRNTIKMKIVPSPSTHKKN